MLLKFYQKFFQRGRSRFNLPRLQSPTYFNVCQNLCSLGWRATRFNRLAAFNEQHFSFKLLASECLEFKHLLAQLAAAYCPQVMPETYCINDNNWPFILNQLRDNHYQNNQNDNGMDNIMDNITDLAWILKPALLNNGKQIKIFQTLSQLRTHYLNTHRLGGEHVLQKYISDPHLLRGHKYSIRLFVVATNYNGVYLYPHGYFNVAKDLYSSTDFTNLGPHLTNEHLQKDSSNVYQIPTQRLDIFTELYKPIKNITTAIVSAWQHRHPEAFICQKQRSLAIFGFDFMVDVKKRVWLLEANHGPCFPTSNEHPLQQPLYDDFWKAFISSFVIPIAKRQPIEQIQYQSFELLQLLQSELVTS